MMFQGCKEDVLAPCEALLMGWRPENKEQMPAIGAKIFSVLEAQLPESGWVNGLPFPTVADLVCLNVTKGVIPIQAGLVRRGVSTPRPLRCAARTSRVAADNPELNRSSPTLRGPPAASTGPPPASSPS